MAVFDEKWQESKASIKKRGIFMFNNDLLSDVSLVVRSSSDEGEPIKRKMAIPAHKFVLSICSPVFFAMFCGEMAERSDSIDLPDCEYEGVLEMLRYMYSEESELNDSNVMQVLYVAKKYMVNSLAEDCVQFLQENLNTLNAFCVLSHAQQYEEKILVDQCWELIDRETEEAVKSEEFPTIERSLLEEIVKRDSITIRELELFKAVDVWATKECERQGLSTDGNVKREILGEKIVKEIRFPVMEEKEFASVVLGCKILTSEEGIDIMKFFNSVVSSPIGFPEKKRAGTNFLFHRFGDVDVDIIQDEDGTIGWDYNSDSKECIDLLVDKDTKLYGIRMFGSQNSDYVVMLKIIEYSLSSVRYRHLLGWQRLLVCKSGTFSSVRFQFQSTRYYGFDVLFDSPISLRKDIKYCIRAVIDGPDSCHGLDGIADVNCHDVKFSFSECDHYEGPGLTGVNMGQFAAFLFRLN